MQTDRRQSRLHHIAAFAGSGLLSLAIDAAVLTLLTRWAHISPFLARVPSVGLAMVAGWLSNRRFTFGLSTPPRFAEFLRYAAASGLAVSVNYAVFSALLLMTAIGPLSALVIASGIAAGVSYAGYRCFTFKPPRSR
ncbi:GtrA family protein [Solirhodobacter olei]|uniref:GtrA family protein n=1 Tax=Solirhodobacter olei TaxID=2493082 RepID=UPI0013E3D8BA|nr:GtrA family protein [Solirhodobacter olei]